MNRTTIILLAVALITGCSFEGSAKINNILNGNNFKGKNVDEVLTFMKKENLYCQREKKSESDKRLEKVTDGTLNDVKFYHCYYQEDSKLGLCVKSTSTYIIAQYNKVVHVNGNIASNACLYD